MNSISRHPQDLSGCLRSSLIKTPHGLFTRHNGVSRSPFSSLNISFSVGDRPANVQANRQQIKNVLNMESLVSSAQIHSDAIYRIKGPTDDKEVKGYDALISNEPGVGLLIQQADCQAVLLHDPENRAIGAVHCGWRGSVLNIINKTIIKMEDEFKTNPTKLRVVISPSLGPCCAEFIHFEQEFPGHFRSFQVRPAYFDFWKISRHQLTQAGVCEENIDHFPLCTVCSNDYFSYRRARKKGLRTTGRQGSAICLDR